jgi:hypothetical protein
MPYGLREKVVCSTRMEHEWQVYDTHEENKVNAFASLGGYPESAVFLLDIRKSGGGVHWTVPVGAR